MEAVVTFEYEAQQDDELTLKVGEVISDVQNVDEGWCEGTLNGKRGMFPDNFVQLREPQKAPPADPAPQIRALPQSSKTRRAKVAFSYAADNIDELSLEPGQIVEVLAEEEEGWWRGKMGGKEGVFPSNFVEIIEEAAEPPKPAAPAASSQPPLPQQSAPPNRPPSPGESAPPEPQVPKHVIGQPVMPKFDPSQALAKLKKAPAEPKKPAAPPPASSVPKPAPPSTAKAPPPAPDMSQSSSSKSVEKAKVTFEYDADNPDELTIKVGEIVEIVNKNTENDGWWEVRLGDRVGLIPDNFVEILPASPPPIRRPSASTRTTQPPPPQPQQQEPKAPVIPSKPAAPAPTKKKPVREPMKKPPKPEPHPPAPTANALTPDKDPSDFGVPATQPLDNSAVKSRPKPKSSRPPSRSNLLQAMEDEGGETPPEPAPPPAAAAPAPTPAPEKPSPAPASDKPAAAPWQRELMEKRKKPVVPKPAPKTPGAPKPIAPSKPSITSSPAKPALVAKPEPPKAQVEPKPPPPSTAPAVPKEPVAIPSLRRSDTPPVPTPSSSSSTVMPSPAAAPPTAAPNNEWKEAFENLREEFEKFKKFVMGEIQTLTDDLDKEIKHRAALEVDIGRLKKSRGFPH